MKVAQSSTTIWITFFGLLLLLTGIFAAGRTAANMYFFSHKYPQGGVLAINTTGQPPYSQKETDCNYPPVAPSYDENGKPLPQSEDQKRIDKQNKDNCLAGITETRNQTKIDDIAVSVLLLMLGGGTLASRRLLFV